MDGEDGDVIGGMLGVVDGRRVVQTSMPDVIDAALDDAARRALLPAPRLEGLHLDFAWEGDVIGRFEDVIFAARRALDDAARLLG